MSDWAVLALVVAAFLAWQVFKIARLNADEIQRELCALIVEFDQSPKADTNIGIFVLGYSRALFVVEGAERRTRLTHALSMARNVISPHTYHLVRELFRSDAEDS